MFALAKEMLPDNRGSADYYLDTVWRQVLTFTHAFSYDSSDVLFWSLSPMNPENQIKIEKNAPATTESEAAALDTQVINTDAKPADTVQFNGDAQTHEQEGLEVAADAVSVDKSESNDVSTANVNDKSPDTSPPDAETKSDNVVKVEENKSGEASQALPLVAATEINKAANTNVEVIQIEERSLRQLFQAYMDKEEARMRENLEAVRYDLDALDTVYLIVGPNKIEKVSILHTASMEGSSSCELVPIPAVIPTA